jgi:hypothetical protein
MADAVTLAVLKEVAEYLARPKRIADHDNWPYDDIDALLASLVIPQEQERQAKKMTISYELEGRCLWHLECETNPLRCSPMFVVATEPTHSLVECTSCKQRGYYPVGGLGPLCCVVVIPQEVNTSSERASETPKSGHVDQPNGSVDGLGVQKD